MLKGTGWSVLNARFLLKSKKIIPFVLFSVTAITRNVGFLQIAKTTAKIFSQKLSN
jgi:hypothetical protein